MRLSNKLIQALYLGAIKIIKNKYTPKVTPIKTQYLSQFLITTYPLPIHFIIFKFLHGDFLVKSSMKMDTQFFEIILLLAAMELRLSEPKLV